MNLEEISFNIISLAGDARSMCMEAIQKARKSKINEAYELLEQANAQLNNAHKFQTQLIQAEANGDAFNVNVLLVHSQDHLMNAITLKDMSYEVVYLHELYQQK
jgi:PTS system cellobiose-specific IIA component